MCVGFYTLEHPEYALVLCSNRDEYLDRATDPACFHSFDKHLPERKEKGLGSGKGTEHENVLSGVDVRAGGTWLGVTRTGRVAFLTNITEEYGTYGSSRGDLVASFLLSGDGDADADALIPREDKYAGFNLLLLTPYWSSRDGPNRSLSFNSTYVTNHGGGGTITTRASTPAERSSGGMSNGIDGPEPDAGTWPKVQHGLHSFKSIMNTARPRIPEMELAENLFEMLTWKSDHPPSARSELRNTVQVEPFVMHEIYGYYGTRLSTVILIKRTGEVLFIERDRWKLVDAKPVLSDPTSQREFRFNLD